MHTQVSWLLGRSLRSVRRDDEADQWIFDFGEGHILQVYSPWRVTKDGSIRAGHCDHRQQFGLPSPIDVEARVSELVNDLVVVDALIVTGCADCSIDFGGGTRLEVFNNSSGYESWMLNGPGGRLIVAQGGGNVAWGKL